MVVGTHTHVPTADERVLPKGTAYITDLGMTGTIRKGLAFDGGDWMLLDQDIVVPPGTVNHDHLYTERPYINEGRFCRVYIGYLDEFPRGAGMPGNALVKVQDWVLVPYTFGFREGISG